MMKSPVFHWWMGPIQDSCSIIGCGIRKLSFDEAMRWKFYGPPDIEIEKKHKWWFDHDDIAKMFFPND